jgi:hypothetical protein
MGDAEAIIRAPGNSDSRDEFFNRPTSILIAAARIALELP